jgi:hypothetical protein
MTKIIVAELRQLWWVQALTLGAGVGLFGLISVAGREFPTNAKTAGVLLNYITTLLICAVPVIYNAVADWLPVIYNAVADWRPDRFTRFRLIDTLPLPLWRLKLARLLAAACALWPAALAAVPLWLLLRSIYGSVSLWLGACVGLVVLLLLLVAMRWGWLVVVFYFLVVSSMVPLYFLPMLEPIVSVPLGWVVTPWASMVVLFVGVLLGWRVIVSSA